MGLKKRETIGEDSVVTIQIVGLWIGIGALYGIITPALMGTGISSSVIILTVLKILE